MTAQRITKRIVDAAKPGEKDVYVWDTDLKGFGLKVTPKGRKVYIAQYRIGKRSRRITIGVHGILTAEEARQSARVSLGQVSSGIDPAHERDIAKAGNNIEDLFGLFENAYLSIRVKPETAKVIGVCLSITSFRASNMSPFATLPSKICCAYITTCG